MPPIWLRESLDKKNIKNAQGRNFSHQKGDSKEDDKTVQDVLLDLQATMNANVKLKTENSCLKNELSQLRATNENLNAAIRASKKQFEEDLNRIQESIKMNEHNLIDNNKKCLRQQKKCVEEIQQLKAEKDSLAIEMSNKEKFLTQKIKTLDDELKLVRLTLTTAESQNNENVGKISKYKNKLKYAITIINDLNNMVAEYSAKPETNMAETQTENESICLQECSKKNSVKLFRMASLKNVNQQGTAICEPENMLLSDIFFKSKAFFESEPHGIDSISSINFEKIN